MLKKILSFFHTCLLAIFFLDYDFLHPKCEKCADGRIYHDRTEPSKNHTWFEVYKCDKCGEEYI